MASAGHGYGEFGIYLINNRPRIISSFERESPASSARGKKLPCNRAFLPVVNYPRGNRGQETMTSESKGVSLFEEQRARRSSTLTFHPVAVAFESNHSNYQPGDIEEEAFSLFLSAIVSELGSRRTLERFRSRTEKRTNTNANRLAEESLRDLSKFENQNFHNNRTFCIRFNERDIKLEFINEESLCVCVIFKNSIYSEDCIRGHV